MVPSFNIVSHCGLTAEVNQSRGASPHTRPRRTARPILLGCSKTPLAKLRALGTSLGLMDKLLSLSKATSLYLRKLAGHPCPDSRNLFQRPAATSQGRVNSCSFGIGC